MYKGTAISLGTTRYLALYTTNPTGANTGTEAAGGSYARQAITFAASASGTSTSNNSQTFTNMAAGTYAYYGILDAASAGNLIAFGTLPSNITVNSPGGDNVNIASGQISFNLFGS